MTRVKWEINEGKAVRVYKIALQGVHRGHSLLPSRVPPPHDQEVGQEARYQCPPTASVTQNQLPQAPSGPQG